MMCRVYEVKTDSQHVWISGDMFIAKLIYISNPWRVLINTADKKGISEYAKVNYFIRIDSFHNLGRRF